MENIKKIEEMLMKAIFEVFEKMFYVFAEPLRGDGDGGVYHMKSAISFNGPVNGMMEVLLSKGIAEVMVKNMLSLDEDEITDPITADCIKEFLNMICGNFVRRLDPEKVFLLSIPTFEMISGNLHRDRQIKSHEVRLMFAAEGGNVEVSMTAARDIQ